MKHIATIVLGLLMICGIRFDSDEGEISNTYNTEPSNTIPATSFVPVTSTETATTVTTTIISTTAVIESTAVIGITDVVEEDLDGSYDNYTECSESSGVDYDTNETYSGWYTANDIQGASEHMAIQDVI